MKDSLSGECRWCSIAGFHDGLAFIVIAYLFEAFETHMKSRLILIMLDLYAD